MELPNVGVTEIVLALKPAGACTVMRMLAFAGVLLLVGQRTPPTDQRLAMPAGPHVTSTEVWVSGSQPLAVAMHVALAVIWPHCVGVFRVGPALAPTKTRRVPATPMPPVKSRRTLVRASTLLAPIWKSAVAVARDGDGDEGATNALLALTGSVMLTPDDNGGRTITDCRVACWPEVRSTNSVGSALLATHCGMAKCGAVRD